MLGQLVLIAIIFVLILILCLKKPTPNAVDDSDNEEGSGTGAANNENHPQTRSTQRARTSTPIPQGKRKEIASSSLYHRKLEEGDSVRDIQSILAAARDSVSPSPSAPALNEEEEEVSEEKGKHHSVCIEIANVTDKSAASPAISAAGSTEFGRSNTAESEGSFINSIRSLRGSILDKVVGPPECTICLEGYQPGQSISWAKYGECDHIYHSHCIEEWLTKHDDCPLCRVSIVNNVPVRDDPIRPVPIRNGTRTVDADDPYYSA